VRIAFLHHVFQQGSGIECVIIELATRLTAMGHDAFVVTYDNEYGACPVPVKELKLPINHRLTKGVFAPAFVGANHNVRNYISDADVIVTSLYPMSLIPLLPRKVGAKVVFINWGLQPYSAYRSFTDKAYLWLLNRADKYAVKHSDITIVANRITQDWVSRQGIEPVYLNLYGVNFDRPRLSRDLSPIYARHKELLFADGIILYAGRQSPHKNIDILIESVSLLHSQGRNVKLLIVGRESFPAYSRQLRMLVKRLGLEDSVIFTGLVSNADLDRYYSVCDVFVNASSWEGFLNPEAYAFKKPIIAYAVSPHEDTVQHGVTGILVEELTSYCFASHIDNLLRNRGITLRMGEAGYQWARENLDYNVITRKFVEMIGGSG